MCIHNKDQWYGIVKSTQYSVVTCMGKEAKEEWIYAKERAIHSSVLAWKIPCTEVCGGWTTVYGVTKSQTRLNNQA